MNKFTKSELAAEADFYQLQGLVDILRTINLPPTHVGNGLIHYLGTNGGAWVDPCSGGDMSSEGTLTNMIARNCNTDSGSCNNANGKYVELQLSKGKLRLTHYSLAWTGTCHKGATWCLSGCNSDTDWIELHSVSKGLLDGTTSPKLFEVTPANCSLFQRFKLTCTGSDTSNSCYCFHVGRLELYGVLKLHDA
eukprot:TRINITY_DN60577_c0_g1_i1.p1 TRINITY_DN60577_c0_g1~~TRINITY_DN60577_c0_g1_i1.p1  ORF type:complete len:223 (+),score=21.67 TRINITY_DN60577_c0_g1_i1:92-670(+)